jgi:acyl-CoA reductase-like NAD-dependent aldehyde dehydrogenase
MSSLNRFFYVFFIDVINPATEEVIGKVAKGNEKDVEKAVQAAHDVYFSKYTS